MPLNLIFDIYINAGLVKFVYNPPSNNELSYFIKQNMSILNENIHIIFPQQLDNLIEIGNFGKLLNQIEDHKFKNLVNDVYTKYFKKRWVKTKYYLNSRSTRINTFLKTFGLFDIINDEIGININKLYLYPIKSFGTSGYTTYKLNILVGCDETFNSAQTLIHEIGHVVLLKKLYKTYSHFNSLDLKIAEYFSFLFQFKVSRRAGIILNERIILRNNGLNWNKKFETILKSQHIISENNLTMLKNILV